MQKYDLGIAYVWEYDQEFVDLTERIFQHGGLSTFRITEANLAEVRRHVESGKLGFTSYLDRAWDVSEEFESLGNLLNRRRTRIFNPYKNVLHAIDKATMHLEFITAGLQVPYSIIIPPHDETEDLYVSLRDLAKIGRPFIIKPCNTTGGGVGVVTGAESLQQVLDERMLNAEDKYLIQEKVYPKELHGRRAWFRCFWAYSEPIPVWWDDTTHVYHPLESDEVARYQLKPLFTLTKKIAELTGLDFFSTEIALSQQGDFVVIDYVNDQCDMRLRSNHYDGVPDQIAERIIRNMKMAVRQQLKRQ